MDKPHLDSSGWIALIVTTGSVLVAGWKTLVSYTSTRARRQTEIEARDDDFATGLRNELRQDITRLQAQMQRLEQENTGLRGELRGLVRENQALHAEVWSWQQRVLHLEALMVAAGLPVPTRGTP